MNIKYEDLDEIEATQLKNHIGLLIITATDRETDALHRKLKPLSGKKEILKLRTEFDTFYLGLFGSYGAAHIQCDMGSVGRFGSHLTTFAALYYWEPFAVLMPGIAFGRKDLKQKPCDVLVSKTIFPYGLAKIQDQFKWLPEFCDFIFPPQITPRGTELVSGLTLYNRFKDESRTWKWKHEKYGEPKVHVGTIMSGNELVASSSRRDKIFKLHPTPIGGEMEGAGLSSAAHRKNTEWIIVKAICDWGNKFKDDEAQDAAAMAAVEFCHYVFSSKNSFNHLHDKRATKFNPSTGLNEPLGEGTQGGDIGSGVPPKTDFYSMSKRGEDQPENLVDDRLKLVTSSFAELNHAIKSAEFGAGKLSFDSLAKLQNALCEIVHNAFLHGRATECSVVTKANEIRIVYNGTNFNPVAEAERAFRENRDRGGLFSFYKLMQKNGSFLHFEFQRGDVFNVLVVKNLIADSKTEIELKIPSYPSSEDILDSSIVLANEAVTIDLRGYNLLMTAFRQSLERHLPQIPAHYRVTIYVSDTELSEFLFRYRSRNQLRSFEIVFIENT